MTLSGAWHRIVAHIRVISGMPDYDAYVRHVQLAHPGRDPLSRAEHFAEHVECRYSGVSRCC